MKISSSSKFLIKCDQQALAITSNLLKKYREKSLKQLSKFKRTNLAWQSIDKKMGTVFTSFHINQKSKSTSILAMAVRNSESTSDLSPSKKDIKTKVQFGLASSLYKILN